MKEQWHYNAKISRFGCYFCSLGKIAEDVTGFELTDKEVQAVYDSSVNVEAMNRNCYMKHPDTVLGLFIYELTGEVWAVKYIGWWNADMPTAEPEMFGRHEVDDATHEVIRRQYKDHYHFGLHNWNPDTRLELGPFNGRRLFQIVVPEEEVA